MADPKSDDLLPLDDGPPGEELTDDQLDALDPDDEIGGDAASHPNFAFPSVLVGPATSDQFNTIEEWIRPVACWRLDDTRFEFDSSFVKPGAARELKLLAEIRADHPGATLSLFGHADPVGNDDYNKALSGRRARAIYGMLIRKPEIWEQLFKHDPICPGDVWGNPSLETMLVTVGRDPAEAAKLDPGGRKDLYLQYMNKLCGPSLSLNPTNDFLAHGGDTNLRGDVQGCSEFNAILRFSKPEDLEFSKPANKPQRDTENAPNRRVVGFLFSSNLKVDPKRWPCPASNKGPGDCRKRFFVDHSKRRLNQPLRREFANDKDTMECRFYHRLAIQSPCESSLLTSLQKIRVRLRLLYKDPMGKERPFPKGYRVSAVTDSSSRNARVGDDGKVRVVVDRPPGTFRLEFKGTGSLYFASALPGSTATPADKLINETDLDDAVEQGFRCFKVPPEWSTLNSDWVRVDSPLFAKGAFSGIDDPAAVIGTLAKPVDMVLDPHWQFLRWEYFDRILLKRMPCLPIIVDGFIDASAGAFQADTRSNWTSDKNQNQCLPWIIRDARDRPDGKVLIQLDTGTRRNFIKTENGSRTLVKVDEGGGPNTVKKSVVDKPSVDRLKFYDLPQKWKSRGYLTSISTGERDVFEKLGAKGRSDGAPLVFSLDDMVLTDDTFSPIAWNPTNDRVAIFSNKLHLGITTGLFRPDSAMPYLSQIPAVVTDRNYLADHPDWTRLIVMRGSLFDVFDRRVRDSNTGVVGARAAVRWADGTKAGTGQLVFGETLPRTVTAVQVGYRQQHSFAIATGEFEGEGSIGKMDHAVLRCCDVVSGVEIGVNLHYLRLNFNMAPTVPTPPSTGPTPASNTLSPSKFQGFANDGIANVVRRWNGVEGDFNKGNVTLAPADSSPLSIPVIWFAQAFPHPVTLTLVNGEQQFIIDVWKDVRAFMSSGGTGQISEDENKPGSGGRFTLAHECGHADSLADEYIEDHFDASYFMPGYREYIPGGPYFADDFDSGSGIMRSNHQVRNRHFWHSAEWLTAIDKTPYVVKYDGFTYALPTHPGAPLKTFVTNPFAQAPNASSGNGGFFDCWLYRFGRDKYSVNLLSNGPFDGFISVNLRLKCEFLKKNGSRVTSHGDLKDFANQIFNGVRERLNGRFFATGTAIAPGTTNPIAFTRARLVFFPRLLVVNDSGDADYHKALDNATNLPYAQLITAIETRETGDGRPTHFTVTFTQTGATVLSRNSVISTGKSTPGTLVFNMDDKDITDDFPQFFVAMLGSDATIPNKAALDQPGTYTSIVRQVIPNGQVFSLPKS